MHTIEIKLYQFSELSEAAQKKAIHSFRNNNDSQFYFEEIIESVKAVIELFNLKTGREYSDIRYSHIEDTILELKGVRLYKYLINNYYNSLFTPKYIKSIDRVVRWKQFICKVKKGQSGEYTTLYSKNKVDSDCVLTGVCYDNDILQPIYDFIKKIDTRTTLEDLFNEIGSAISKTFEDTEEWINSDEFIKEEIEANEYEFLESGKMNCF